MKKFVFATLILTAIISMSSCNYDDSNDIDIIMPNDSTQGKTSGAAYL
jgi:hypothetical protein